MTFIKTTDINKNSFYKIEKELFNNSHYQKEVKKEKNIVVKGKTKIVEVVVIKEKLSDTSKILYSILCDLLPLSVKNNWYDKNQNIYIRFSVEKLAKLLNKSIDTIVSCKKELEANELIKIVKKGYGKADVIFLCSVKKSLSEKDIGKRDFSKIDIDADMDNLIHEENNITVSLEKEAVNTPPSEKIHIECREIFQEKKEIVEGKPIEKFDSIKTLFIKKRKTTNREKRISSSYDFLKKEKYPLVKNLTITNIEKFIPNLTENQVDEVYSLTEKAFSTGKIKNFNAVFYMALKKEWVFLQEKSLPSEPSEEELIKNKFENYLTMFKACDNFEFALECLVNSIDGCSKELQDKYIQKFEALNIGVQTPAVLLNENYYSSFLTAPQC